MNKNTRTIHGIDPYAEGGIKLLLDHHRATFGDAVMEDGAGAPSGTPAGTPEAPAGTPAGTPEGTPAATEEKPEGTPANEGTAATDGWDGKIESLPADVQKIIRDLRAESADRRTKLTASEQRELDIKKALGLVEDEQVDPADLTAKLADKDARINSLLIDNALSAALSDAKASPLTADILRGRSALKDLDPTADDFKTKLSDLVTETLSKHPELKLAQAAGSSGADFTGSTGEQAITKEKFSAMSISERNDLFQKNPTLYRSLSGR